MSARTPPDAIPINWWSSAGGKFRTSWFDFSSGLTSFFSIAVSFSERAFPFSFSVVPFPSFSARSPIVWTCAFTSRIRPTASCASSIRSRTSDSRPELALQVLVGRRNVRVTAHLDRPGERLPRVLQPNGVRSGRDAGPFLRPPDDRLRDERGLQDPHVPRQAVQTRLRLEGLVGVLVRRPGIRQADRYLSALSFRRSRCVKPSRPSRNSTVSGSFSPGFSFSQ